MKYYVSVFYLGPLLALFSISSWADVEKVRQINIPFSADLVEYNLHYPALQRKIWLQIGQEGARMMSFDLSTGQPNFIKIENFNSGKEWLVRPDRLYYSELILEDVESEAVDDFEFSKGVLGFEPCLGRKKQPLKVHGFKGGELSSWSCLSKDGKVFIQHYSSLLGLVVRQEAEDGHVFELRNIVLEPSENGVFSPSDLWREVTLEAFFMGVPVLPVYIE